MWLWWITARLAALHRSHLGCHPDGSDGGSITDSFQNGNERAHGCAKRDYGSSPCHPTAPHGSAHSIRDCSPA